MIRHEAPESDTRTTAGIQHPESLLPTSHPDRFDLSRPKRLALGDLQWQYATSRSGRKPDRAGGERNSGLVAGCHR